MGKFFLNYLKNKIKIIIEGKFDFVDVRDAADILIKTLDKEEKGKFYIICNKSIKISELIGLLDLITGRKTNLKIIDNNTALFVSFFNLIGSLLTGKIPLFTPYSIHPLSRKYKFPHLKAKSKLNYKPRNFESTLFDTLKWFKEYYVYKHIPKKLLIN